MKKILVTTFLAVSVALASRADDRPEKNDAPWPPVKPSPPNAPNVVLILLDDVGYSWSDVFGGPVPTPNIDKLANRGLRYNNFHVNALCSPTRAALLSGRNAHEIGFSTITEGANRQPGYTSVWPKSAASVAEVLKRNGYSTAAFGKWHNTPTWEVNPAGPFDHWPTSLGFEYFYGFLGGATTQYDPLLFRNTLPVSLPKTPEQGYLLNHDLVDQAEAWLHQHDASAPARPFFLYFATGAIHAPHHVPRDWIAKFKGQFDLGWDKQREATFAREKELGVVPASAELTPRPKELPAWDSLNADEKKLYAAQAELYAAYLAETDFEIGRLLDDIKSSGHTNDTAVFVIVGDNGASGEGGLEGTIGRPATVQEQLAHMDEFGSRDLANHVESAWAWAAVAPFQWMKQVASHLGGTTDPLIISWPGHIKDEGDFRRQFSFVTDIAPTIYELAGISFPAEVDGVKQLPLAGSSLGFSFDHPDAPSRHNEQYFEMVGNRGIYKDGWWAGSRLGVPWNRGNRGEPHPWELYNLTNDFSQAHDLAAQFPEKVEELTELYTNLAAQNHVYPKNDGSTPRARRPRARLAALEAANTQTNWVFGAGAKRIPVQFTPKLAGHDYRITAEIETAGDQPANGVIFAEGGRKGGVALFVKNGTVIYEGNPHSDEPSTSPRIQIISPEILPKGKSTVEITGAKAGKDFNIVLAVNGKTTATGQFKSVPLDGNILSIGENSGSPVSHDYTDANPFNGVIQKVSFTITSPLVKSVNTTNLVGPWSKGDVLAGGDAPEIANHALTVSAEIQPTAADGVIIAQGADVNGFALYLKDGRLTFAVRSEGQLTTVAAAQPLGTGRLKVAARLEKNGQITLLVNDQPVGSGHAPGLIATQPARGLSVGKSDYLTGEDGSPGEFAGQIENARVEIF